MKLSERNMSRWADILLWVLPLLLVIPNVALCFTEQAYSALDCAVNVILPLGVYYLLCALSSKIGRTAILFFPLMILCAFQIVLLFLYGESIIAVDMFLNVATTSISEVSELLTNLTSAIVVVCVIYFPPLIMGVILCICKGRSGTLCRKIAAYLGGGLTIAGLVLLLLAALSADGYNPRRKLFPVNVITNMFYAVDRTLQTEDYAKNSADFTFSAISKRPQAEQEVYIMVIGETSRSGNWQLGGYRRDTNPCLSHRNGLVFFSKALSESNTTHKSVPLMMSHLSADEFGDSIYRSKGIIEAFVEAGYGTAWFSNQKRNHSLIDFFGEQADSVLFINDDGKAHYDEELCPLLQRFLATPGRPKKFIVLHTYGSHFNYRDRFPAGFHHFADDSYADASAEYREQLVNAYDNTIRYTDNVLDRIISMADASGVPSALVYLADHGEDIFDDERGRFLHASPTPTAWQIHVPLLVWMSDSYRLAHPDKYEAVIANSGRNVSTSRSAFHTLLSLAGIDTPVYDASAALSENSYEEPSRRYLNDYDEAVALSESGMRKTDMDYLAHARINH